MIFLLLPLAIKDTGKSWYFWVGSSSAAIVLGAVLFHVVSGGRQQSRKARDEVFGRGSW
jgi:hypothetical protein